MMRKTLDRLISWTGLIMAVVLAVAGALLIYASSFVASNVREQLSQQNITMPTAAALQTQDQKDALLQFAGQKMENGAQAKAFADHYIKVHLGEVANGQTYAQVSAKALANPDDQKLAGQVQTLFRGETLRGLLLNAYAFDTMATVAWIAARISLIAGVLLLLMAFLGIRHARTTDNAAPAESPMAHATT